MQTLLNFKKIVKQWNRFDDQLKYFAQQFEPFINSKIKEALENYANLHGCINDMKHQVNDRLRGITIPNLARFEKILERESDDIIALQSYQTLIFSAIVDEDSE